MGRELAAQFAVARRTYEEASAAVGFDLARLCFEGPEDALVLTANTQPAILTTSIAVLRVLEAECGLVWDVCAGHSLGEWSALVAARALQFADAVRLVNLRGQFMQEAVPPGEGAMAAILGLAAGPLGEALLEAAQGEVVTAANLNGAGQIVIAGHKGAVERAMVLAKARGAKRAVPLPVSAPFHCPLMAPAAARLDDALLDVAVMDPVRPVVTNVDATPNTQRKHVKPLLVAQVTAPVRWEESVQALAAMGVTRALELGAGSTLSGLVKRIAPTIQTTSIGEPHEVLAYAGTRSAS
ncbi:MAG: [acyl-carrier-protein] S-malonyltransferase [Myxococcales bacterium]|nr:[acyl-carrier-protein] S-malonyltransferase [Myxococcales bacterium]